MYSLDINFLKERQIHDDKPVRDRQKIELGNLTPIWIGAGVGVGIPALAAVGLFIVQMKTNDVVKTVTQITGEMTVLDQKIANIAQIKRDIAQDRDEVNALVSVFDRIRPWAAILQDLRDRIPPTVQIDSIKQITPPPPPPPSKNPTEPINLAGGLELTGYARSFNDVNDFLLILQQSKFLKSEEGKITTTELVPAPISKSNLKDNSPPLSVVKYTIKVGLNDVSAFTLIQELQQKGSVGLATRLLDVKKTGVIPK